MKKIFIIFTLLLVFGGCAIGRKIDVSQFDKVKLCKTTKTELLTLFGNPKTYGRESGFTTMYWEYASAPLLFVGSDSATQEVIVYLNDDNIIIDYAINPASIHQPSNNCSK